MKKLKKQDLVNLISKCPQMHSGCSVVMWGKIRFQISHIKIQGFEHKITTYTFH